MIKNIGIIGLGKVGEATIRTILKYRALIKRRTSVQINIKGVCDLRKKKSKIASKLGVNFTQDAFKLINDPDIDIIVELIGGQEPAKAFICEALKRGKNVVTANKALLAQNGKEVFSLARRNNKTIGFEASVCGAIPLIKSVSEGLVACDIKKMYGILNGTTNYILYQMSKEKIDFKQALSEAQKRGIAERKPSLDIEGKDTLHKLCILSYLSFGIWPSLDKVYTEGISSISLLDILYAQELNYHIKLLAIAKKEHKRLDLRVHPTLIPIDHPLSETPMAFNAVLFDTEPAGELLFYGLGAGGVPTSSSVVSDIVNISEDGKGHIRGEEPLKYVNIDSITNRFYLRLMVSDRPGVLAHIAKILASFKISIASVNQKDKGRKKYVPIVMITHEAKEANIRKALARIDQLAEVKGPSQKIRIDNLK